MLNFETLASSSAGCAYRVSAEIAWCPLLIECGLPFKQLQKSLNFKVGELAGCLVSHAHQDHCKAVRDLMKCGCEVFASEECWSALGFSDRPHNACLVAPGESKMIGPWSVTPFDAVHDCPGTLGFVIDSPTGERLLYLSDTCYSKFKFEGLSHIAIECNHSMEIMRANVEAGKIDRTRFSRTAHTHFSLERVLEFLKVIDKTRLQEIHLMHLSAENSDSEGFKLAVEKVTGIPTHVCPEKMHGL